ncbi:prolyl 4-hydroxylase subunit alpha-2-like [Drosophila biarmipes]|uniref:prolyl 4-hydroxylase subunit alpha-2-like n=1 Tax=Drosophila biarmipes TaxID=125945 RepID=UPI0021CD1371|nr:prolyl 4-hydroxylase subunit alpha-2-like [Drosophila biarmipes]
MKTALIVLAGLVFAHISFCRSAIRPASSTLKLTHFLQIHKNLVEHLENYIKTLDSKLKVINEALVDLATYHIQFEDDKLAIISSPVGSYSLIHHMQSDWTHWQLFLQEEPGKDELESLMSKTKYLPMEEDVSEVCQGISSIINAYYLLPKDIARGSFLGKQYMYSLSPLDCLRMADYSIANKDLEKSKQWLQVAISILENPSYIEPLSPLPHVSIANVYLKLAEVFVKQRK